MLSYKLLGGLLILGSGSLAAFCSVRGEKNRLSVLDGWLDLILYIRGQIDCYLTPLDAILSSLPPHLRCACMAPIGVSSLHQILQASAPHVTRETYRLLLGFVREIGSSYREEQVRRCDYYLEALRCLRQKIAAELPARIKLSATLCLCAAAGATILLW